MWDDRRFEIQGWIGRPPGDAVKYRADLPDPPSEIAPVRQEKNPIERECGDRRESREVFCPSRERDNPQTRRAEDENNQRIKIK